MSALYRSNFSFTLSSDTKSLRWQHSVEQHVCFLFLVHQFRSSLFHYALQIIRVFLQLMQHTVNYVKLSTTCKFPKCYIRSNTMLNNHLLLTSYFFFVHSICLIHNYTKSTLCLLSENVLQRSKFAANSWAQPRSCREDLQRFLESLSMVKKTLAIFAPNL